MIVRFKRLNRPEIVEIMADPENMDYWIDTEKHSLCLEINKKVYTIRHGKEETLSEGLDFIHEAVTKGSPFMNLVPED